MIELAVILVAVAVIADVCLIALEDVRHDRARLDRRWRK